jgi:hypothetical protein
MCTNWDDDNSQYTRRRALSQAENSPAANG